MSPRKSPAAKIAVALCSLSVLCAPLAAQGLNWNQDVLPQVKSSLKIQAIKPAPALSARTASQAADDSRIYGVPAAGPDSQFIKAGPTDARSVFFGIDYIADYDHPSLQVIYTDFDGNEGKDGQTGKVVFNFPQLKVDLHRWVVTYKGSVVAQVREDHDSGELFAVPTNGYSLVHENTPLGDGTYRIDAWFAKEPAGSGVDYYKGTMTFDGKTRNVCFGVSKETIPMNAHPVYPFQEGGAAPGQAPEYLDECASALVGGYINACSGLVLDGAPASLHGDVAVWSFYNIGEMGLKPVGRYDLQKTDGCDPNFLFDSIGD